MKELLTPEEAARLLKVDPATIRAWLRAGKLKGVKLGGGHWRISEEAITAFIGEEQAGE